MNKACCILCVDCMFTYFPFFGTLVNFIAYDVTAVHVAYGFVNHTIKARYRKTQSKYTL